MNVIILSTCANNKEAKKISKELVSRRLVACVNIIDNIDSVFWWQNKIDSAKEVMLIAKSKKSKIQKIVGCIKSLHSYKVPEIIALPIIAGDKQYIDWINESC